MSEVVRQWLASLEGHPSCMACAVRLPRQAAMVRSWDGATQEAALDHAARSVVDVFQILKLHRLPSQYLQWTFASGNLHALCRGDEWALLVVSRKEAPLPEDYLQELAAAFLQLGA
jgi:hypothetical protein